MQATRVLLGDCKELLKTLDSNSFDSLVTDPPAGISFMGEGDRRGPAWDCYDSLQHFQEDLTVVFKEVLRVLKPGAHGLVWALPRTSMFTGCALISAGFEIRDSIIHLFGSGMPKGLNVTKAGAGPEWEGWNTTLKPAHEIWWLVRKPLHERTVVKQLLANGTGAINVDACRVPAESPIKMSSWGGFKRKYSGTAGIGDSTLVGTAWESHTGGRWPANAVLSHAEDCVNGACSDRCVVEEIDADSGISQFFYTSKVTPYERKLPDGSTNQHPTAKAVKLMRYFVRLITPPNGHVLDPFAGSGTTGVAAVKERFSFLGIELDPEHYRVATLRITSALDERAEAGLVERMLADEP